MRTLQHATRLGLCGLLVVGCKAKAPITKGCGVTRLEIHAFLAASASAAHTVSG